MARKLTPEELERFKADFDPPAGTEPPDDSKKKMPGRDTEKPVKPKRAVLRGVHLNFKFSEAEAEQLDFAAKVFNVKRTRIVAWGIGKMYAEAVALAKKPKEEQPMNEEIMRAKLKEAGYSLRKERGGEGYMIIQGDINGVVGGSGYTFTLSDVADFIKQYCK